MPEKDENLRIKRYQKINEGYGINDSDKDFKYYYDRDQSKKIEKSEKKTDSKLSDNSKFPKKAAEKKASEQDGKGNNQQQ